MGTREEILRMNQHLRESMTDDEIVAFAEQLDREELLTEENCSPELWAELTANIRSDNNYNLFGGWSSKSTGEVN
ncbi:hypothetical protein FPZ43_17440 [Mucilaginibacter pallidiroseus]|uniref:Uncharacterized protein n=1 Tax=Mucilaginibacter pallidiroseus TaxID=2599295 RepID=A0A563U118_9SPHI|nr:hypothetical protein [Mucilaginibacter pallidiroseus]TWR25253.1 hypothetical protein FPZ43_17440 [Mucilaginibacter pallidiroseus]